MQHYFYGGDKDGEEVSYPCRDFIVTVDPRIVNIKDLDYTEPVTFYEIKWIHAIIRTRTNIKHVYVREDLYSKLALK